MKKTLTITRKPKPTLTITRKKPAPVKHKQAGTKYA